MPDWAPGEKPAEFGRGAAAGGWQDPEGETGPDVAGGQGHDDVGHAGDADNVAHERVEDAESGDEKDGDKEHHGKGLIVHEAGGEGVGQEQKSAQGEVDTARYDDDGLADGKIDQGQAVLADRGDLELAENGYQGGVPYQQGAEQEPDAQGPGVARQPCAPDCSARRANRGHHARTSNPCAAVSREASVARAASCSSTMRPSCMMRTRSQTSGISASSLV